MNVVEQIHSEIDASIEELEQALNAQLSQEEVIPSEFELNEFAGLVGEYRFHYLQNTFITEKQLARICKKYGLVCGASIAFEDAIPKKNLAEIERFKVKGEHLPKPPQFSFKSDWKSSSIPCIQDYVVGQILNSRNQGILRSFSCGRDDFNKMELEMRVLEEGKKFFVLLGDEFGFSMEVRNRWGDWSCRLFVEFTTNDIPQVYTIPVDFAGVVLDASFKKEQVMTGWGEANFLTRWDGGEIEVEVSRPIFLDISKTLNVTVNADRLFRLFTEAVYRILNNDLGLFDTFKVVAPLEKFNQNVFRVEDGYRLHLDYKNWLEKSSTVPDPIILQPVKGGYLVVTKWGDESMIGEVQNAGTN